MALYPMEVQEMVWKYKKLFTNSMKFKRKPKIRIKDEYKRAQSSSTLKDFI